MSQEILPLGNCVAATQFPKKYCRSNYATRSYFLGNIAAIRKYGRTCISSLINKMEQAQNDTIVGYLHADSFPSTMTKNEKDFLLLFYSIDTHNQI